MRFDFAAVRDLLQKFEFASVFREHLGWSRPPGAVKWAALRTADGDFERRMIAELSGVAVFEVRADGGVVPNAKARAGIHKAIAAHHHEHLLIFVDDPRRTRSLWSWVKRGEKREQARTHYFFKGQPGDLFLGKLDAMVFDLADFDAEGHVPIVEVARKLRAALDVEQVTEKFYKEFQEQHRRLVGQIEGIRDERDRRWYASVLLNRLMFVYFLQRKSFVDGDLLYLQNRLAKSKAEGADRYYRDFLALLFFEGFAKPEEQRSPAARACLGRVRYLNGGLFLPHAIEQRNTINLPDQAFEDIYTLFERYTWNLDDTPGGNDREINPHVLGFIFEKYINDQKASGAYYTRPELTAYLCEQTIHRLVLDGVNDEIVPGMPGSGPGGLPRRFTEISDLLLNLDARLCWRLLENVLPGLKLLDPACGSGAFLVAAAEELRELYGAVVGQAKVLHDANLKEMIAGWEAKHPSLGYFFKKRIISHNLFGVDLNEEATEIARLRLFLALVASANDESELEPLPNVDFNIMAGNSLIGLLHVKDERFERKTRKGKAQKGQLGFAGTIYRQTVEEKNRLVEKYRDASSYADDLVALRDDIDLKKAEARKRLDEILLEDFNEFGIRFEQPTWDDDKNDTGKNEKRPLREADIRTLHPFHWDYEFDEVFRAKGGFDAILANPPWEVFKPTAREFFQEHSDVITTNNMSAEDFEQEQRRLLGVPAIRKAWFRYQARFPYVNDFFRVAPQYKHQMSVVEGKRTGTDTNLYKLFVEQCLNLLRLGGQLGMVVPGSLYSDLGAKQIRAALFDENTLRALYGLSNERYLFGGVHHSFKVCLFVATKGGRTESFEAAFRINPREAIGATQVGRFLRDRAEHLVITPSLVRKTSPASGSIMEFRGDIDVRIVEKMLSCPLLGDDVPGAWKLDLCREFHVTDDRALFKPAGGPGRLPLYEGKMIHQYDWRYSEPRYWVDDVEATDALRAARVRRVRQLARENDVEFDESMVDSLSVDKDVYRLAFRQVARNTDARSMICAVLPPAVVANDTLLLNRPFAVEVGMQGLREVTTLSSQVLLYVLAMLNSFVVDWFLRQRIAAHAIMFYVYQLPVPRLTAKDAAFAPIVERAAKLTCTTPEFDALASEVGLESHAAGETNPERRSALRAEIDGLVAHLYGLTEEEFVHILNSFPVVPEPQRAAAHNAYRDVARGGLR